MKPLPALAAAPPPPVAKTPRGKMGARLLEARDLDAVAGLFLSRFRGPKAARNEKARAEVADYMKRLYLDSPNQGAGADSLVQFDAAGAISAFIGVIRTRYLLDGAVLHAGMNGVLMTAPGPQNSLAAVQLLRDVNRLPLDLVFTDSANRASLALGQALKYKILSPQSLEWAKVFDPAALVLHKLRQRAPALPWATLRPLAEVADLAFKRATRDRLKSIPPAGWRDIAIDASAFVDAAPRFLSDFRLRPEWSRDELTWLTTQAAQRQSAGPLNFRLVLNGSDVPVGCYAFYGEKGGVARVLHVGAHPKSASGLLAMILQTAQAMGCIGAHGTASEGMLAQVYATPGMFLYYAGGTMVSSQRADVLEALESGSAFVGGFAGDRWTRLGTDTFGHV